MATPNKPKKLSPKLRKRILGAAAAGGGTTRAGLKKMYALAAGASHPCLSWFWEFEADDLEWSLDQMEIDSGPAHAPSLPQDAYDQLVATMRAVERALGVIAAVPDPHVGGSPDGWGVKFFAARFSAVLAGDQMDTTFAGRHRATVFGWLVTTGTAETGAIARLNVIYTKIKNALGA